MMHFIAPLGRLMRKHDLASDVPSQFVFQDIVRPLDNVSFQASRPTLGRIDA